MAVTLDRMRRDELLAQIEHIVLTEGFADLRVGTLAQRLHCSRSTLYKLAESKDELVLLVFRRLMHRALDRCRAEAHKCEQPADKILAYFRRTEATRDETTSLFWRDVDCWSATARLRDEMHRVFCEDLTAYISEGIAAGVFRPVNPRFVAHLAWVGSISAHQPTFLDTAEMTWPEMMEALADFIISGLSCPGDGSRIRAVSA